MSHYSPEEAQRRIAALQAEHRELDAHIEEMLANGPADELHIKRMKKRKLQIKDWIARLHSDLIPDEPA